MRFILGEFMAKITFRAFNSILSGLFGLVLLAGCGTRYDLPQVDRQTQNAANAIFAEERRKAARGEFVKKPADIAVRQYLRVVRRVEPVAERICSQEMADQPGFDCDVRILVDDKMPVRNAYQTYDRSGRPLVAFTIPLIADAQNEDELAFVLGHEVGHHIAQHSAKKEQQALAGGLLMGVLTAYAQAGSAQYGYYSEYQAQQQMQQSVETGMQLGHQAYSQTYELEADLLGTYIAEQAGYDAVRGARYFARPEAARLPSGLLSFWGTHPPDEIRLATVISTVARMEERLAVR